MSVIKKDTKRDIGYLAIFIVAALTLTIKIVEVSSANTLEVIVKNPEISQYSRLVQTGYFFER
jgi:hypothetical protein